MPATARNFAMTAHGDQRYGAHPYVVHLDAVAQLALPYGDDAMRIAYLHDTVEDTDVTVDQVAALFGPHVAACVALLTDQPGANRKERKAKTYARLAEVSGPLELALIVKAADRLANVRACVADCKVDLWRVYQGEHAAFQAAAYRAGLCDPLWQELAELLTEAALPQAGENATGQTI